MMKLARHMFISIDLKADYGRPTSCMDILSNDQYSVSDLKSFIVTYIFNMRFLSSVAHWLILCGLLESLATRERKDGNLQIDMVMLWTSKIVILDSFSKFDHVNIFSCALIPFSSLFKLKLPLDPLLQTHFQLSYLPKQERVFIVLHCSHFLQKKLHHST